MVSTDRKKNLSGGTLMSTPKTCFLFEDFHDELPDPGFYPGSIKTARFRRSANKNRMLQVVHALEGVESAYKLVTDYFVLEGETVSPSGIFLARRRLVELYQACRIFLKSWRPDRTHTTGQRTASGPGRARGVARPDAAACRRLPTAGTLPIKRTDPLSSLRRRLCLQASMIPPC